MSPLPAFSFLWPTMLWLLASVPVLTGLYVWQERRRRRAAVRYPALRTVGLSARGGAGWRRHAPAVLILLALAALATAVARPQAVMTLPSRVETVILAMDMSGSMKAEDVKPSRIGVARQVARAFVDEQPAGVRVGVVAVAGTADVAQPPSRSKDDVAAALDRLQPQRGSALGNGLVIALKTLLPRADIDAQRFMNTGSTAAPGGGRGEGGSSRGASGAAGAGPAASGALPGQRGPAEGEGESTQPGSYTAGAIVLFSDGEGNAGPEAVQAARVAAEHGVRIYTVGVGTPEGVVLSVDGWKARVRLDDKVLRQVADMTGAQYYRVDDAAELKSVYRSLSARLAFDKRDMVEITALFAALGALLAACAALLSLWWFGRVL